MLADSLRFQKPTNAKPQTVVRYFDMKLTFLLSIFFLSISALKSQSNNSLVSKNTNNDIDLLIQNRNIQIDSANALSIRQDILLMLKEYSTTVTITSKTFAKFNPIIDKQYNSIASNYNDIIRTTANNLTNFVSSETLSDSIRKAGKNFVENYDSLSHILYRGVLEYFSEIISSDNKNASALINSTHPFVFVTPDSNIGENILVGFSFFDETNKMTEDRRNKIIHVLKDTRNTLPSYQEALSLSKTIKIY